MAISADIEGAVDRVWQRIDKEINVDFQARYRRGRPLGSDKFISKLEVTLGRRLRPLPGGRPKKKERK